MYFFLGQLRTCMTHEVNLKVLEIIHGFIAMPATNRIDNFKGIQQFNLTSIPEVALSYHPKWQIHGDAQHVSQLVDFRHKFLRHGRIHAIQNTNDDIKFHGIDLGKNDGELRT